MKHLEEFHGYKTLKKMYLDSISEEVDEKSDENNAEKSVSVTGDEQNKEQSASNHVNTVDESKKRQINKLKRDIVTLQAEMKARSDKIEQNDDKLKIIRSNIMKHLQQSLSDLLFESSSMSLLVKQLSSSLSEDEYEIGECGLARIKSEAVFKELSLSYETSEEEEIAKVNFVAFGKAVESQLHVKMSSSVERRLSINVRTASPKRKNPDDIIGNDSKKVSSRLPAPSQNGKGKSSPKLKEKKMTLQQFHTKNSE